MQIKKNKTAASAKAFLNAVHKACPMRIQKVHTDHGKEFTDRLFASRARQPTGEHEFDPLCVSLGIEHRLTKPRTPRTNGMVERFNGRIADVLRSHRFQSGLDLEQTLLRYSIGYKRADGSWAFRLHCPADNKAKIAELRREAIRRAATAEDPDPPDGTFAAVATAWMTWQQALPSGAIGKRAASTLDENEREIETLKRAFGHMRIDQIEKGDAYAYLDACLVARDADGNPRPRQAKGNKEIALARRILERAVRKGWIKVNPFDGVEKLATEKTDRLVTDPEMALAVEVGRRMDAPQKICALALKTAWLCVRRSVEVRALTRDRITEDGIVWSAAKRQRGEAIKTGLIEWSPELRATIDEVFAIERRKLAGSWYVFGNLDGQKYTKGGWKSTLAKLMRECVAEAERRNIPFAPFSLQDCRPKGVSDKLGHGDSDVIDATMHSSERMVRQIFDRRRVRVAKPAR